MPAGQSGGGVSWSLRGTWTAYVTPHVVLPFLCCVVVRGFDPFCSSGDGRSDTGGAVGWL